jgi:hypothetical protein
LQKACRRAAYRRWLEFDGINTHFPIWFKLWNRCLSSESTPLANESTAARAEQP